MTRSMEKESANSASTQTSLELSTKANSERTPSMAAVYLSLQIKTSMKGNSEMA